MRHTPVIRMPAARLGLAVSIVSSLAFLAASGSAAWADGCTAPSGGPAGPDAPAFTYQCDGTHAGKWTSAYYAYDPATGTESPLYSVDYSYDCGTGTWKQSEWDYNTASSGYVENWVPATTTPDQLTNCATSTTNNGVSADNTTTSTAQSGDASVTGNDHAGDATSGNGSVTVTQANLVDSSGNAVGGAVVFNADINGTSCGAPTCDFTIDPNSILPPGTGNGTQPDAVLSSTSTDVSLSNTITATAASGNATVSGNGDAGDATSGSAQVIINLINIINSAIASGQSFIGTINIYGDFNGNIYIPQAVVDQLLAAGGAGINPNLVSATNESIVNNVAATAQSGDASVSGNGHAGSATTGSANANVVILNLTGSSIIGKNVLLVFVNVLGTWVGMIVNAPAGATTAEFAGGASTTANPGDGSVVEASTNLSITNNVDASAQTGNALVADNHRAGNATSGSASVAINILNIEDSYLSLANWFGILFINVFGTWNGNFAILSTPTPVTDSTPPPADGVASTAYVTMHAAAHHFPTFASASSGSSAADTDDAAVLGAATLTPAAKKISNTLPTSDNATRSNYVLPVIGVVLALLLLAAAERERLGRLLSRK